MSGNDKPEGVGRQSGLVKYAGQGVGYIRRNLDARVCCVQPPSVGDPCIIGKLVTLGDCQVDTKDPS